MVWISSSVPSQTFRSTPASFMKSLSWITTTSPSAVSWTSISIQSALSYPEETAGRALSPGLPVVGRVAAGSPILAEEHIEEYQPLDPALFRPRADYLLRVRGSSMRDAGILDADLLAVHRIQEAQNGQIVVARLDDEVTVKRYRQNGSLVSLLPENEEFEPIEVDLKEQALVIEGVVVGVIRDGLLLH